MTPDQIPQLLKQVSYADPRMLPEDHAEVIGMAALWAEVLSDVPLEYAITVVGRHYAESPFPIKPSDIATRWRAAVRDRMNRHTDPAPDVDPDDTAAYLKALAAQRHAVATGQAPPSDLTELTGGPHPDVQARLDALGRYVPAHVKEQLAPYRPRRSHRESLAMAGLPDPLDVKCGWCRAEIGEPCRDPRVNPKNGETRNRPRRTAHPSRLDAATEARENADV